MAQVFSPEDIRRAVKKFRDKPERTRRQGLRKGQYEEWLVIEQNPKRDSPYASLRRAGIIVAHIIHETTDTFSGFVIKNGIYLKPILLENYFDAQILNESFTKYFSEMKTQVIAAVQIEYHPDEDGKALVTRLAGNDMHTGIRLDLIEDLLL